MAPDIGDVPASLAVGKVASLAVTAVAAAGRVLTDSEEVAAAADAKELKGARPTVGVTAPNHFQAAPAGFCCEWAFTFRVNYDTWREKSWQLRTGPDQIEFIDEVLAEAIVEKGKFPRHRLDLKIYETWLEFRIALLNALLELLVSQCGLQCQIFKSAVESWDASSMNLLVLVHIPERSAWEHAKNQSYQLPLDASVARQLLPHSPPGQREYAPGYVHFNEWLLWHYMDKHRDASGKENPLFQQRSYDSSSLFGSVDQMRLIRTAIIEHVDMKILICNGIVNTQFPLHSSHELARLSAHWALASKIFSCSQPLKDVHAYFGEQVGFYFAWVGYQTKILIPFALLGGIAEALRHYNIASWYSTTTIHVTCGVAVVLWSAAYLRLWCRRENALRTQWVALTDDKWIRRQINPNYRGDWVADLVTGSPQRMYPARKAFLARALSWSITGLCLCVSAFTSVSLFVLRSHLEESGVKHASYITAVLNAIQIKVFDVLWTYCIVMKLIELENWRYLEKQRNALIWKMFLFRAVNAFAASFWIAFVKRNEDCSFGGCVHELRFQLASVFATYTFLTVWVDIMLPWIVYQLQMCIEDRFFSASASTSQVPRRQRSYVERQATMYEYDWLAQIEDYTTVTIQCGMVLLFFTVLPAIALLAAFSQLLKIRADAWKLCHTYRRPFPEEVAGVGAWNDVIELLAYLAMGFNAALVIFTTGLMEHRPLVEQWLMLFAAERAAAMLTQLVKVVISDSTTITQVTQRRHSVVLERLTLEQIGCKACSQKNHPRWGLDLEAERAEPASSAKWPEYVLGINPPSLSDQLLVPYLRTAPPAAATPGRLCERARGRCWAVASCRGCQCCCGCGRRRTASAPSDHQGVIRKRKSSLGRGWQQNSVLPEARPEKAAPPEV